MITMCVYQIALSGTKIYQHHVLECNFVHLLIPLLVLFDYLLFEEKGHAKKKQALIWVIPLIIYATFVEIYSLCGGLFLDNQKSPYPFLDVSKNGAIYVLGICLLFVITFIALGFLSYKIDNLLKERESA